MEPPLSCDVTLNSSTCAATLKIGNSVIFLLSPYEAALSLPHSELPSLKSMAGLVDISTGHSFHDTGVEIRAGFADSVAGFWKFGAELLMSGQTKTLGVGAADKKENERETGKNVVLLMKHGEKWSAPHLSQMRHICIKIMCWHI